MSTRLKRNGNYWLAWWRHPTDKGRRVAKSLGHISKTSKRRAEAICRQMARPHVVIGHGEMVARPFGYVNSPRPAAPQAAEGGQS